MKPRIDDLDREIFDCLREDARMPASEIARRLGHITARAVRNRIDRLVEEGFIAITAGAVPERLGFPISADIYIDVEPGEIEHVANKMAELDEVFYVAMTTGDTDISASTVAVSMGALQEFISTKLHTIPGVTKTKTYVLTKILKQSCDWAFPEKLPKV
ncbi:MAG: Lrp/AsnC family transcriptional regulator [Chloroflexi bacterium]|jgi:Lrp/AsnC family transcriptional regulator, regulator for asnA, asnC and gidA|nr:Lrp/AsnC family transcriptional regulator [Chloroflexota bacterium]